ncbi:WxL domain-containing protein [Vagococcus teuberi]|uniref:WxL domain-containing protein n=1 Tax=Vagococcus teuberi TaxID=519472 RepID=A0A1J0A7X6_9ENTE|nr:WxL domain-containing protein [Vagococcus teuberi]APB32040.1 hypothetical protein BHY08_09605 [Vagococcus teuberi]
MRKKMIIMSFLSVSAVGFQMPILAAESASSTNTASFNLVSPKESLTIVADDLSFRTSTITANDLVTTSSTNLKINIQEISGNAPGWSLTAQLGDFVNSDSSKVIKGTQLFYPNVTPTTTTIGDTSSIQPKSVGMEKAFSDGVSEGQVINGGGDPVTIADAAKGTGYGSWTFNYAMDSVELKIPAGNLADAYTANLTYTLADKPTTAGAS